METVRVLVNGELHVVEGADLLLSLSDYLRRRAGLLGTKVVCAEGDCGACTVLVAGPLSDCLDGRADGTSDDASGPTYRTVDSCIAFMHQLHRCHVVTVEGVPGAPRPSEQVPMTSGITLPGPRTSGLSPLQDALVAGHGSQCGFCTPGFVMSLTGVLEEQSAGTPVDADHAAVAISGNLCRCTGYVQILESFERARQTPSTSLAERYPTAELVAMLGPDSDAELDVTVALVDGGRRVLCTGDSGASPGAQERAARGDRGGWRLGRRREAQQRAAEPRAVLDISRLVELDFVARDSGAIVLGARATWARVEQSRCADSYDTAFARVCWSFLAHPRFATSVR